jgi:GntR family transcriptional regulator
VLPFPVELKTGLPVAEQILFQVKKAIVSGLLKPGDRFPSIRQLSQDLRINPNTAHKVIAALVAEGVLVTTPAVGSVVAMRTLGDKKDRAALLGSDLEKLVVEAKKLGLALDDVQSGLEAHWNRLSPIHERH